MHSQAGCKGCHDLMDPIGFGLENYDMAGRYREFDDGKRAEYRKELALRVSSMARLFDLVAAVQENLKVAQAKGLIEPETPTV